MHGSLDSPQVTWALTLQLTLTLNSLLELSRLRFSERSWIGQLPLVFFIHLLQKTAFGQAWIQVVVGARHCTVAGTPVSRLCIAKLSVSLVFVSCSVLY